MSHISSVNEIKSIMSKHGLNFQKSLGQNFLFDEEYLSAIIDGSGITENDTVLEIGPGLGVLTTRLAEKCKKVIAVEIDKKIVPVLTDLVSEYNNIEIINNDIMKISIDQLTKNEKNVKVVANLPYYITTPIVMKLLEEKSEISSITVMIQKEVAERFAAAPGSKDYGAITLSVNYYSQPEIFLTVPPEVFVPSPKVYSSVINLKIRENPPVNPKDEKMFFKLIKFAFAQRRKTLINALASGLKNKTKEEITNAVTACGLNEKCRGETLSMKDFERLSDLLSD